MLIELVPTDFAKWNFAKERFVRVLSKVGWCLFKYKETQRNLNAYFSHEHHSKFDVDIIVYKKY